ncbi:hypothetical protein EDB83DRAFT_2318755 [Lactarius deliciosus]|nr:hypothetical protein EDB83DRAFT_2318755 [Lactarius deliciosus]
MSPLLHPICFHCKISLLLLQVTLHISPQSPLSLAVQKYRKDWVAVMDLVQHSAANCSYQCHQHIQYKGTKWKGAWSSEEEGQLLHAIEGLAWDGKLDMSAQGFWVFMSKAMGATWTPKQCQSKWIASLDIDDKNDIDWRSL